MTEVADESAQVIITSPPYWQQRIYEVPDIEFPDGWRGQFGMERSPQQYIAHSMIFLKEMWRVLRKDGVLFYNIADKYISAKGTCRDPGGTAGRTLPSVVAKKAAGVYPLDRGNITEMRSYGLKPKDLGLIPERFSLAAQDAGWTVRGRIIWHKCLAGTTPIYARSQGRAIRTSVRELTQLPIDQLELPAPDGKWRRVLLVEAQGDQPTLTLHLRNGSHMEVTPEHRFPTERGLVEAKQLQVKDSLTASSLPPEAGTSLGTYEVGWVVGFYLAEGSPVSMSTGLQFAMHAREVDFTENLRAFATNFAGDFQSHVYDNSRHTILSGKAVQGVILNYVDGKNAKGKHLSRRAWEESNTFLEGVVDGFLNGDGHYEVANKRWQFSNTWNPELLYDLKTACRRIGWFMRANPGRTKLEGKTYATFRGEIRKTRSGHFNQRDDYEIRRIEHTHAKVYEISIDSDDHLFVLPDGVVTHNSNCSPEAVKDRPAVNYEIIWMLTKRSHYYYNKQGYMVPTSRPGEISNIAGKKHRQPGLVPPGDPQDRGGHSQYDGLRKFRTPELRAMRSVWSFATEGYGGKHRSVFPEKLVEICIRLASREGDLVLDPFLGTGTTLKVAKRLGRRGVGYELGPKYLAMARERTAQLTTEEV